MIQVPTHKLRYGLNFIIVFQAKRTHCPVEFLVAGDYGETSEKGLVHVFYPFFEVAVDVDYGVNPEYAVVLPGMEPSGKSIPKVEHQVNPSNAREVQLPHIDHKRQQAAIEANMPLLILGQINQQRQPHNHIIDRK